MFSMRIFILSLASSVLLINPHVQAQTLLEVLSNIPELSKLSALLQPYATDFSGLKNITFLAPSNVAVDLLANSSTGAALASVPDMSQALLFYHILNGTYPEYFGTSSQQVFVPTALQPPSWTNVTGGQRLEIVASSGDSEATAISGLRQSATLANCTSFDGGNLYVIDEFLTIPQNVSTTAIGLNLTSAVGALTCYPTISQAFNQYANATVFLPTDEAFQQVGGNLAELTSAALVQLIEFHATTGRILYSPVLQDGMSIGTLWGNLKVTRNGSDIYVNNARVIQSDFLTANGVLHVIDRVLNPANTTASRGAEAFPVATSATYVPFTSGVTTATSYIPITGYSTSPSTSASSSGSGSDTTTESKSSSSIGAIAGGVVGGILGLALILIILWSIRRKPSQKGGARFNRKDTTKSYRKPELEAKSRSELESKALAHPVIYEVGTPESRPTEMSGGATISRGLNMTGSQETSSHQEQQSHSQGQQEQEQELLAHQHEELRKLQREVEEREEREARMTEVENQRRLAELDYQRRMTELEHEQRMAELNISAARIRSHSRTVSELEARANPGPGDGL